MLLGLAVVAALLAGWLLWPPASTPARPGPEGVRLTSAAVFLVPAALLVPRGVVVPGLIGVGMLVAGRILWRRRAAGREAEETAARLVEVCDLLASELASGRTAEAALGEAALVWPVLTPVADACRLGGDVPEALRAVADTPGAAGLRLMAAGWAVSRSTGAGLAATTRRVADAVRRDQATRRVVAGELASARATARLVAGLPVLALLMGSGAGGDPWSFLLATPAGLACLAAGLATGFAGLWWIELIAAEVDR